jgi:hypothetical protein
MIMLESTCLSIFNGGVQDMHTNIAHALVAEVKARELDRFTDCGT